MTAAIEFNCGKSAGCRSLPESETVRSKSDIKSG